MYLTLEGVNIEKQTALMNAANIQVQAFIGTLIGVSTGYVFAELHKILVRKVYAVTCAASVAQIHLHTPLLP